jgi:hypothetical protein
VNAAMVEVAELCSPWTRDSPSRSTCSKGDSPLGIHTLPEYTTGVAGEDIPDAYGLTMAAYRSTMP